MAAFTTSVRHIIMVKTMDRDAQLRPMSIEQTNEAMHNNVCTRWSLGIRSLSQEGAVIVFIGGRHPWILLESTM